MECDKKYIAKIIKNARKKQGLTQAQLSELIGITEKHFSKIETGNNYPALDTFFKIAEVLNLSLKDFGLVENNEISKHKEYIYKIINLSSEKQLLLYTDIIESINKHF